MTKKTRQSNIELLRILAMFLVLVVHADFWSNGQPTHLEILDSPLPSFARYLFQSLSIVCVDVFILISGLFSIKASKKGLSRFLFQCLFFLVGIYIVCLITGHSHISIEGIRGCFLLLPINWFIKSYLLLYILSPVLNSFCETATKKNFEIVLIGFFVFQSIYGITNSVNFFEQGYSTMSFVGLYLLSRYLKLYGAGSCYSLPRWILLVLYFIISLFVAAACILKPSLTEYLFTYIAPTTILASVSLLLYFTKLSIPQISCINFFAASSFAVFLLHSNPNINTSVFREQIRYIYAANSGVLVIVNIAIYLILVYFVATMLDQLRIVVWNFLEKKVINKIWNQNIIQTRKDS